MKNRTAVAPHWPLVSSAQQVRVVVVDLRDVRVVLHSACTGNVAVTARVIVVVGVIAVGTQWALY